MYCPHCGTESTQGLNYCNRCGGNLSALTTNAGQETRPAVSTGKVWAIGTTTMLIIVLGFGMLFAAMSDMLHSGMQPDVLKLLIVCAMVTILGALVFLGRLWTRILGLPRKAGDAPRLYHPASHASELGTPRVGVLPEAQINPISSVTEHTTRTLKKG